MRAEDSDEREDPPATQAEDAAQPDDREPWAKTSSGDAESVIPDDEDDA